MTRWYWSNLSMAFVIIIGHNWFGLVLYGKRHLFPWQGTRSSTSIFRSLPMWYNFTLYLPLGLYIGAPSYYGYILLHKARPLLTSLTSLSLMTYNYDPIHLESADRSALTYTSLNLTSLIFNGPSSTSSSGFFAGFFLSLAYYCVIFSIYSFFLRSISSGVSSRSKLSQIQI